MVPQDAQTHSAQWHDRLQDLIDGTLEDKERVEVQTHLHTCESCRIVHTKLLAMHSFLKKQLGTAPMPGADFSARVFASIDEAEQVRRAAARVQAEREFQKRVTAFELDWRSLWQRHMGSIIAGVTTVAAVSAMLGASWASLRGQLLSTFPSLVGLQSSMSTTATALAASVAVSAAALLYLRSKTR
jgi:anti-sigma factor RsiW